MVRCHGSALKCLNNPTLIVNVHERQGFDLLISNIFQISNIQILIFMVPDLLKLSSIICPDLITWYSQDISDHF